MDEISGIIFAEIAGKGTKSGGYKYYLQPLDDHANRWSKILVRKQPHLWENDPVLHKINAKKMLIFGEIIETRSKNNLDYEFVIRLD